MEISDLDKKIDKHGDFLRNQQIMKKPQSN